MKTTTNNASVRRNRCLLSGICVLSAILLWGCNGEASPTTVPAPPAKSAPVVLSTPEVGDPSAQATLQPTYTPYPTYTQYPTFTPFPATLPPHFSKIPTLTILGIPQRLNVKVISVGDGDTFEVELGDGNKDKVRLLAVDAPETNGRNQPNEYAGITDTACLDTWGLRAAEFAVNHLENRNVTLLLEGPAFDDLFSFGRLLAFVILEGENFNALLVERGLARVFTEQPNSKGAEFLELQQQAQARRIGFWECAKPDSATGIIVTPTPTPVLPASPTPKPGPTATPVPAATSTPTPEPTSRPTPTAVPTPFPHPCPRRLPRLHPHKL